MAPAKNRARELKFELQVNELRIAVRLCLQNKLTIPAMVLLYSAMDAMAWLARPRNVPDVRPQDFEDWINKYMLTSAQEMTSRDLYAARCAILHSHTAESRRSRSALGREIWYLEHDGSELSAPLGRLRRMPLIVDPWYLLGEFELALGRFQKSLVDDANLREVVYERADKYFERDRYFERRLANEF